MGLVGRSRDGFPISLPPVVSMAVPRVVPESQISVFKFYDDRAIHEAVLWEGTILRLAGVFDSDQKREALEFAYGLSQDYATLITPSAALYRVWVDIRYRRDFNLSLPLPMGNRD
jgi:hypothetical protein